MTRQQSFPPQMISTILPAERLDALAIVAVKKTATGFATDLFDGLHNTLNTSFDIMMAGTSGLPSVKVSKDHSRMNHSDRDLELSKVSRQSSPNHIESGVRCAVAEVSTIVIIYNGSHQ
jgi:hypothetical protein